MRALSIATSAILRYDAVRMPSQYSPNMCHWTRSIFAVRVPVCARYLAEQFPAAGAAVGFDLSPHMVLAGQFRAQEDEVSGWAS